MKEKCIFNRPHPVCASMNNHQTIKGFCTWVEFSFMWNINGINSWNLKHEEMSLWNTFIIIYVNCYLTFFTIILICISNMYMVMTSTDLEYIIRKCIFKTLFYYPRRILLIGFHWTSIISRILIPFLPKYPTWPSIYFIGNVLFMVNHN